MDECKCESCEENKPFYDACKRGEIDRQNILPNGTKPDIENAVKRVYDNLWPDGAVTGQCEFGPAEKSENIFYIFEAWNKII